MLVVIVSCHSSFQPTLEKIRALDLNAISGKIKTYYPAGYEDLEAANVSHNQVAGLVKLALSLNGRLPLYLLVNSSFL